ncbi:hypothetical protein FNO01nite_24440 [Flavobacterium noncentrifugens]|uniref:DUF3037 domain-containing protein n=1 Tax=Flavobacterium noncentrifugens TaxID=1128970 RepID=A0A1G8ZZE3_9FLAO|nr:DUF3037 domain-containing protein [Flavobacterium noncentrifugens]GEP51772.1 hypothetical protein FNO01nite_24440 [Flavobacterium noncentrifugens]SDK20476.1 Protein of unknown function [Flavobacterium noncentrifugens]
MQEQHLYEYAVIRVVPRVDREEFLNIGVILFCKRAKFIRMRFTINAEKMALFASDLDVDQLRLNLIAFEKVSLGLKEGGPIAQFDVPERFRWLTAIRSSVIQTSRPHPGMSANIDETFDRLFADLVL